MDLEDELLVQTHEQSTRTKEASWNSHKTLTVFPQAAAILPLFKSWQRAEVYEDLYSTPEETWGQETRVSIDLPVWVKFMSEIFFLLESKTVTKNLLLFAQTYWSTARTSIT